MANPPWPSGARAPNPSLTVASADGSYPSPRKQFYFPAVRGRSRKVYGEGDTTEAPKCWASMRWPGAVLQTLVTRRSQCLR